MANPVPPPGDFHGAELPSPTPVTSLGTLAVAVVTVAALYFGREVLVPLAVAVLLSFALGPLVLLLRRWHIHRLLAVGAVVGLAFLVIVGIGGLIGSQLAHLAGNLPRYQTNIAAKIDALRNTTTGSGVVRRAVRILSDLGNQITSRPIPAAGAPANPPTNLRPRVRQQPVPVEIRRTPSTPLQLIAQLAGPLLRPLATVGIIFVFVIFFLLRRQDLRDRFIRLAGARDLHRTTQALDDAARRLSRYLLVQTAINAGLGVLIGAGLWFIGVPNPVLWGILTMFLRFVPYIGSVIAAAFPAALAVAVDPGWAMLAWVVGLFIVAEGITGQVIEPWLYGHSMGLSTVAILIAAAFWTLLWGPIGLLLSTPLTMCLVVLGRHVEHLQFLEVLLGDRPALAPQESFYQRMLADDPDEAAHQAEAFLKDRRLADYYDEVAIGGLALAQLDVTRGALDHAHRVRIKEAVESVIDDLADHEDAAAPILEPGETDAPPVLSPEDLAPGWQGTPVLCIAGRGSLDEAAAAMLAQLLDKRGIGARVVPSDQVSVANLPRLDVTGVQVACLSYLEPGSFANPRYLVRRLRRRLPRATLIDGFWTLTAQEAEARGALAATGATLLATSLRQAAKLIVETATGATQEGPARPAREFSPLPAGHADQPAQQP